MSKKRNFVYGEYFYGNKISDYGIEHGRVDYETLAKAFDAVLNNDIMAKTDGVIGYWDLENGTYYDEEGDSYAEVFQWFIISGQGARILEECTDELVWYNEELDMYLWGVTHWGTGWDYVLTDIKCNVGYDYEPEDDEEEEDE